MRTLSSYRSACVPWWELIWEKIHSCVVKRSPGFGQADSGIRRRVHDAETKEDLYEWKNPWWDPWWTQLNPTQCCSRSKFDSASRRLPLIVWSRDLGKVGRNPEYALVFCMWSNAKHLCLVLLRLDPSAKHVLHFLEHLREAMGVRFVFAFLFRFWTLCVWWRIYLLAYYQFSV